MIATLRVCASCEWIYRVTAEKVIPGCPDCGFGSYAAHHVYGRNAYRYAVTQKPWFDKQMAMHASKLLNKITKRGRKS